MTKTELEEKVKMLEKKVQTLEDIEAIKKLQRAYGFYLEHWMAEDLADLFADSPEAQLRIAAGEFTGKEAIRRFFRHGKENTPMPKSDNGEFLHQVMQLSGVVDVEPDGLRAKGRWYGFGANAFPVEKGVAPGWMNGVYEVEYIKENGIWKMLKVRWCMTFHAPWTLSFVDEKKRVDLRMDRPHEQAGSRGLKPTGEHEHTLYPSGFICPFHFKNPVSGRKTA
jgi:hypothetical protein